MDPSASHCGGLFAFSLTFPLCLIAQDLWGSFFWIPPSHPPHGGGENPATSPPRRTSVDTKGTWEVCLMYAHTATWFEAIICSQRWAALWDWWGEARWRGEEKGKVEGGRREVKEKRGRKNWAKSEEEFKLDKISSLLSCGLFGHLNVYRARRYHINSV